MTSEKPAAAGGVPPETPPQAVSPRNAAAGGGGWCFDVIDVIDAVDIIDVPKTRRRRRRVPQNTPAKCPSAHGADVESTCVLAKLYGHERPTRTPYTIKVHPALSWVEIQSIAVEQYSRFEVFGVAIASRSSLDRYDLTVAATAVGQCGNQHGDRKPVTW
jgi:hypothetical protein